MKLIYGDSLEELDQLQERSVDSCITDPPYELGFMGRQWDKTKIAFNTLIWEKVLRVLKPGSYLLAFGATRNYHRLACAIEDAGFIIKDCISWIYGSGFPKALDISKAIDAKLNTGGSSPKNLRQNRMGEDYAPTGQVDYRKGRMFDPEFDKNGSGTSGKTDYITEAATAEAKQWEGWKTALKPAQELIVVAQKPLDGTYVNNVLKWGVGGLNINGCRIAFDSSDTNPATNPLYRQENGYKVPEKGATSNGNITWSSSQNNVNSLGRYPANVLLDEEAAKLLDEQSGVSKSGDNRSERGTGGIWQRGNGIPCGPQYGDSGGSSRFFYTAKASQEDRAQGCDKNHHPTVKPVDLMQYLVRLVTPKGGLVLDPFMGSGSTGKACLLEGMDFIGIEKELEYFEIAKQRIGYVNPDEFALAAV